MKAYLKYTSAALIGGVVAAGMMMFWHPGDVSPDPVHPVEIARALPEEEKDQEQRVLLAFMEKDVTGDGLADLISLIGAKRDPEDSSVYDVQVVVQDLQENRYVQVPIEADYPAYNPRMDLIDLDRDGIPDLFVTIDGNPQGEIQSYSLLTFKEGQAAKLVQSDQLNAGVDYRVLFQDGFKAELTRLPAGETVVIDIESRKDEHIKREIYDENGKLLQPLEGKVQRYSSLIPVQKADGTYYLEGRQYVYGFAASDRLAAITSRWAVQNGLFRLTELDVKPYDWDNEPSPLYAVNDKFEEPILEQADSGPYFILDSKYADVNGDGSRDHIVLLGNKIDAAQELYSSIKVAIKSSSTGEWSTSSVGEIDSAYNPKIWIGRFTEESIKDIFVTLPHSRYPGKLGGGAYSLLTFTGGELHPIVDQKQLNEGLQLDVIFKNSYKAEITSRETSRKETVDVYPSKERYVRALVYDPQGKLMQPAEGTVGGFVSLVPVDTNGDGIYDLKGTQIVSGAIHTEDLAAVESVWSVRKGRLELVEEAFTERK